MRVLVNCTLMLARTGNTCPATVTCRRNPQCHGFTESLHVRVLADTARTVWVVLMTRAVLMLKLCLLFPTNNTLLIGMQISQGQGLLLSKSHVQAKPSRKGSRYCVTYSVVLGNRSGLMESSEKPGKFKSDCIGMHGGVMEGKERPHLLASI